MISSFTEVSLLQRCPYYRGVLTTGVPSLQGCPHYRGALTTEVIACNTHNTQSKHTLGLFLETIPRHVLPSVVVQY